MRHSAGLRRTHTSGADSEALFSHCREPVQFLQGLLTTASKTNGRYSYKTATVPFLAEIVKLVRRRTLHAEWSARGPWSTVCLSPPVFVMRSRDCSIAGGVLDHPGETARAVAGNCPHEHDVVRIWRLAWVTTLFTHVEPHPLTLSRRSVSRFVVPSFIYLVHNNVQFWTLRRAGSSVHCSSPIVAAPL